VQSATYDDVEGVSGAEKSRGRSDTEFHGAHYLGFGREGVHDRPEQQQGLRVLEVLREGRVLLGRVAGVAVADRERG